MLKPDRIIGMTSSFFDSCVLFTASDLGVFASLAESGPMDSASLASALQLDQRGTRLLLDACVALELLNKEAEIYSNTPETAIFLVPGSPGDLSAAIRYNRDVYAAWGKLYTIGLLRSTPRLGEASALKAAGAPLPAIRGAVPSLARLPQGCAFAPRCDHAVEACAIEAPAQETAAAGRMVRCRRWREIADAAVAARVDA